MPGELLKKPDLWRNVWMDVARTIARMSKDPSTKVGCVVVSPDQRHVTVGFNGFASSIPDYKDWWENRGGERDNGAEFTKYEVVVHAEENAILKARTDLSGWSLYVTHHPCLDCAKVIVTAGIKTVHVPVGALPKMDVKVEKVRSLFKHAGVELIEV